MYNVYVDTGGTMTDGLVSGNGAVLALRAETTSHDVTAAFIDIPDTAKDQLGFAGLRTFLDPHEVIWWSSRLVLTAAREPQHREARRAPATMCIGVGHGISVLPERVP